MEIVDDINQCYEWAKNEYKDNFDEVIVEVINGIRDMQISCKEGTSYYAAAYLAVIVKDPDMSDEDHQHLGRMIKASVAYLCFAIWEEKYGKHDPDRMKMLQNILTI